MFFSGVQVWRKAFGSVFWMLNASEAVNEVYLEVLKRALRCLPCNIGGPHQRLPDGVYGVLHGHGIQVGGRSLLLLSLCKCGIDPSHWLNQQKSDEYSTNC